MTRNKETGLQSRIMADLAHKCVLFRIPAETENGKVNKEREMGK